AHNLYLETLAELGPVGLALLLAFVGAIAAAAVRARRSPFAAAGTAGFAAFAVHAAVDWDFQIVAVSLAGLLCAAALLVAAREPEAAALSSRRRGAAIVALLGLAAVAIAVQVGNSALANGRAALDRGALGSAQSLARRAHRWQPWSYEPWQLLGETSSAAGDLAGARRSFRRAIELDRRNWSLWYDLAQVTTGAARKAALAEASRLNPQSPELAQSSPKG
ncbi:MAG TPA: hypothetical protein VLN26_16350, partial [Gaiellaceae bacterium]|nr:hypothetical protein [Gaiellaceae bacterium]